MKKYFGLWLILGGLGAIYGAYAGDDAGPASPGPAYTGFSNIGSITNTRHNMTQSTLANVTGGSLQMDGKRNNYFEVCVYCHTPHGANINAAAPLWNRALSTTTTYQTYNQLNTSSLTQTVYQPGAASLPCLSCHDGQQAVDAIINMPGSGKYDPNPTNAVLTAWRPVGQPGRATVHLKLAPGTLSTGCLSCHQPDATGGDFNAVDFSAAFIGTDLRNDHPVGVNYPATSGVGTDWNTPGGSKLVGSLTTRFFDENPNGYMDKTEIRLYGSSFVNPDTSTTLSSRVECASCHDPHGVPTGAGGTMQPTFLRKTNTGSAVCMTCHNK